MKRIIMKVFGTILSIVLCISMTGCSKNAASTAVSVKADTWSIYLYMCGSDLESDGGAATVDLDEIQSASLPENVNVVIETGGSSYWDNDYVYSESLGRYLYSKDGMKELDQLPSANMGESSTLADFLKFASTNYPAEHTAVIFWNHGGVSNTGVCFDELYDDDSLELYEIQNALASVYKDTSNLPLELVGFDACLMASIDTAYHLKDYAHYMVASEETEPNGGWGYEDLLNKLSKDPSMTGDALGKIICDTYEKECKDAESADNITMSVIDLTKADPLFKAYNELGDEALSAACKDPSFLASFGRGAYKARSYGENDTANESYTNMVDLYDLVYQNQDIFSSKAETVMDAINDCVVYKVSGPYAGGSSGISAFYAYGTDTQSFEVFSQSSLSKGFQYLYGYQMDDLGDDGYAYIADLGFDELYTISDYAITADDYSEWPVYIDDYGFAVMELDSSVLDYLTSVSFRLNYTDEENDLIISLGSDNNINGDWSTGIFKDNFYGYWGSIDGNLVYMDLEYEGDDYNLYTVPILLNGDRCNLSVAYDYTEEEYVIIGAKPVSDEDTSMSDRNLIQLKAGDEITSIMYGASYSGDDDFVEFEFDTFTVTDDTSFYDIDLGEGDFWFYFVTEDFAGNEQYSQNIYFTIEGDTVYSYLD